jgi:hypothetical protein
MVKEKKKEPFHIYFLFEYPVSYFNNCRCRLADHKNTSRKRKKVI